MSQNVANYLQSVSHLSNNRGGWNKRGVWDFLEKTSGSKAFKDGYYAGSKTWNSLYVRIFLAHRGIPVFFSQLPSDHLRCFKCVLFITNRTAGKSMRDRYINK